VRIHLLVYSQGYVCSQIQKGQATAKKTLVQHYFFSPKAAIIWRMLLQNLCVGSGGGGVLAASQRHFLIYTTNASPFKRTFLTPCIMIFIMYVSYTKHYSHGDFLFCWSFLLSLFTISLVCSGESNGQRDWVAYFTEKTRTKHKYTQLL
jgi:hypothetical protein